MPSCTDSSERTYAKIKARLDELLANETFVSKLKAIYDIAGIYPTYLMAIMINESGICTSIQNPKGKATGLFQRMPDKDPVTKQLTGTLSFGRRSIKTEEFRNLSAVAQMDYWVDFFRQFRGNKNRYTSPGTVYGGAVFLPDRFSRPVLALQDVPGDLVLTRRADKGGDPDNQNFYKDNAGLDINKDGYITIQDLDVMVEKIIISYKIPLNIGGIQAPPIGTRYFYAASQQVTPSSARSAPAARTAPQSSASQTGITPYLASFQSFHPKIQYELTRRKFAAETAQVYMPALRLTSLSHVLESDILGRTDFIGPANVDNIIGYCPSIGPHGENSVSFDDIYNPGLKQRSTVGYATINTPSGAQRIPLIAKNSGLEPDNIPMPGIVSVSANRSLAGPMGVRGGLFRATIKIAAYSVGQVDTLMRYFLRSGTHLVLELGQLSSSTKRLPTDPFNWVRPRKQIEEELRGIVVDKSNDVQDRLIRKYVYDNFGNYEIFIGYAAKFNIKYSKANAYEIELTMHSTQQFEVNNFNSGIKSNCNSDTLDPCVASDIVTYFSNQYSWMDNNFKKAISNTLNRDGMLYSDWNHHVIPVKDTNPSESSTGTTGQASAVTDGNSTYLISWKYFVNVILNNETFGILNVFPEELRSFMKRTVISDTGTSINAIPAEFPREKFLIPNEVGYHPNLRSIDPGIMVIYNDVANKATQPDVGAIQNLSAAARQESNITKQLIDNATSGYVGVGDFSDAAQDSNQPGSSLLTRGVWLNSNAIIDAFVKTDNISRALDALLTAMNNATQGYWNLQLLSLDTSEYPGVHVVDVGLSKSTYSNLKNNLAPQANPAITKIQESQTNIQEILNNNFGQGDTPKYIYVFNNKNRRFDGDRDDLGGELVDLNLTLDLPTAIAAQVIAGVGGQTEKSTIRALNLPESKLLSMFPIGGRADICVGQPVENRPCLNSPDERARIIGEMVNRRRQDELAKVVCEEDDENQEECNKRKDAINKKYDEQITANKLFETQLVTMLKTYKNFGNAIRFIELNPARMLKQLSKDSENDETSTTPTPSAHAFNSSNLTKLLIDLTMPGIGGILLWQSFYVDKIPSIMENGYYAVIEVGHDFNATSGWTTKIQGRYRRIPDKTNKSTVADPTKPVPALPQPPSRSGKGGAGAW